MTNFTNGKVTDLCLFGSCVCGHSIRFTQPNNLRIKKFVQFFSPLSMFDKVAEENRILPEETAMEGLGYSQHGHWIRSACAALNGEIPEVLRQNKAEWLVIDNYYSFSQTYEITYRNGDTRLIQSTNEIRRLVKQSSKISNATVNAVPTPPVDSWIDEFVDFVKDLYGDHVILIGTRFAKYTLKGDSVRQLVDNECNTVISNADLELLKRLNCHYIEIPEHAIAVDDKITVHYVKEVYEYVTRSIKAIIQLCGDELVQTQRELKLEYDSILQKIIAGTKSVTYFDLKSASLDDLRLLELNDSLQARILLSKAYKDGKIVPRDSVKSIYYMKEAFRGLGEPLQTAYYSLLRNFKNRPELSGSMQEEFWTMTQNLAAEGYPPAMTELAELYRDGGGGIQRDQESCKAWFRRAFDSGDVWAGLELSNLLLSLDDERSHEEGASLLTEIADSGNAIAKGRLGRLYLKGTVVTENRGIALTLLEDAYSMGVEWAGLDLSDAFIHSGSASEASKGISILQNLSNKGNSVAMGKLGRAYRDGIGVEKDVSSAIYWLQSAYMGGVAWAGVDLMNMEPLLRGQNLEINQNAPSLGESKLTSVGIQGPEWKQGPIYVVICGAVRNLLDVASIILRAVSLCNEGIADGIILSTWEGEFEDNPEYKHTLESLGVRVIQSKPLPESWNEVLYLNNTRQAVQLNAALDSLPEDCYILKCRTDLSFETLSKVLSSLPNVDLTITERNRYNVDFHSKILVANMGISALFHSADISFYGHSSDVRKMMLFESRLYLERDFPADCGFFMAPFIHRFPLMADVLKMQRYWDFSSVIKKIPECSPKPSVLPMLLNKVYAQYFLIVDSCFICYDLSYMPETSLTMDDLFTESSLKKGIKLGWIKTVSDTRIIHKLVTGDVESTLMYDSFRTALKQALDEDPTELAIEESDVEEYNRFISQFGIAPAKWNRSSAIMKSSDVDNATAALAPYISGNDREAVNIFKEVSTSQSSNYYRNLVNQLDTIRDKDPKMYEFALISCTKGTINSDSLLKDLAYALYKGLISEANTESANYPFVKFGINKKMYFQMPSSSNMLLANYYYSLYSVDSDDRYSELFINSVSSHYELTFAGSVKESLKSLKSLDPESFDDSQFCEFLKIIKSQL